MRVVKVDTAVLEPLTKRGARKHLSVASVTDDDSDVAVSATSGTVSVSVSGLGACEAPTQ